jgi:hypothetical protein
MIQVGVGQEDALDLAHLFQRKVADPGSGVNQGVIINQERCSPAALCNCAGTA